MGGGGGVTLRCFLFVWVVFLFFLLCFFLMFLIYIYIYFGGRGGQRFVGLWDVVFSLLQTRPTSNSEINLFTLRGRVHLASSCRSARFFHSARLFCPCSSARRCTPPGGWLPFGFHLRPSKKGFPILRTLPHENSNPKWTGDVACPWVPVDRRIVARTSERQPRVEGAFRGLIWVHSWTQGYLAQWFFLLICQVNPTICGLIGGFGDFNPWFS